MSGLILALVALGFAALPCGLFFFNLRHYRQPAAAVDAEARPRVSVLIPARNEAASIRSSVESALASEGVEVEVVVLDDDSTDATAAIVAGLAEEDP
ncbi:MAG: glycosyltransferase, partial [Planctomycetaceae bacterium]|nr:glycosyltransferase [Planctomycetaceae bacterium]